MKYKSIFYALILCIFSVSVLCSCEDENVKRLKKDVASLNLSCPQYVGNDLSITSAKYDEKDNTVTIEYSVIKDSESNSFLIKKNYDIIRSNISLTFTSEQILPIIKELTNAKANFVILVKAKETLEFKFSYDELNKILNSEINQEQKDLQIIKNNVELENNSCPAKIEDGLVMTKAELKEKEKEVIYYLKFDESEISVSNLSTVKNEMKQEMLKNMDGNTLDPQAKEVLEKMQELGFSIIYRVEGEKSKKSFDIVITPNDYQ